MTGKDQGQNKVIISVLSVFPAIITLPSESIDFVAEAEWTIKKKSISNVLKVLHSHHWAVPGVFSDRSTGMAALTLASKKII